MYDIAAKLFPLESKEVQIAIMDELCAYKMNIFQNMVQGFLTDLKMYYHYYQKDTGCL